MPLKVTLYINLEDNGWSETYYFAKPSNLNISDMVRDFTSRRAELLGFGSRITAMRVSDTDTPGVAHLIDTVVPGEARAPGKSPDPNLLADQASACVLVPFKTERGTRRYVTLRGFPDAWLVRARPDSEFDITAVGRQALSRFYRFLLAQPWPLMIRERRRVGNNAPQPVTEVTVHTPSGQYQIYSPLAATITPGQKVTVTKLKGRNIANLRGIRRVTSKPNAGSFTVDRGPRMDLGSVFAEEGGLVSLVDYNYSLAQETREEFRASMRRTGRPFSWQRGRR